MRRAGALLWCGRLSAALAALEGGASVILLERSAETDSGGLALLETLRPLVLARGGRIFHEMTATQFLLDDALGVTGVKALSAKAGGVNMSAGRTILACGGFEGNPAMLTRYMGQQARFMRPVAEGGWNNKGEGIRLALDIGAAPAGDYAEAHRQPIDPRSSASEALVNAYPLGIMVNAQGRRFMEEAPANPLLYLEEHCRTINRQPGCVGSEPMSAPPRFCARLHSVGLLEPMPPLDHELPRAKRALVAEPWSGDRNARPLDAKIHVSGDLRPCNSGHCQVIRRSWLSETARWRVNGRAA